MNTVKKTMVAAFALAALGTGAVGIGTTLAASNGGVNPMSNIVTAIATKFNLQESDVQAVFDAQRETMRADMEVKMQEQQAKHEAESAAKLAQAVTDGKLTQAQADAITAKRAELKASMDARRTETKERVKQNRETMGTEMKAEREALEAWATANGIPTEYLSFVQLGPEFGGHGPANRPEGKGGMGFGFRGEMRGKGHQPVQVQQ